MNKQKEWLENNSQVYFYNRIECLEWFIQDDISQLYTMIEEDISLDDWFDEMSHRIVFYEGRFYILEEDDVITYKEIY